MNSENTAKRYSPRKLARSMAKARMEREGFRRINRKRSDKKTPFQVYWRDYVLQRSVAK